jgi:hypothetical protein
VTIPRTHEERFVTRPAQAPEDDPTQEPNVRTHRMMYPNRRPLLISAILVALTSIPTLIVVAAGTATLHDQVPPRPPGIADPSRGPVVVQPHSSAGLREEPPLAAESGHGRSTDHNPDQTDRASGSGGGGAFSGGTGGSRSTGGAPPATSGSTGGPGTAGGSGNGGKSPGSPSGSSGSAANGGSAGNGGSGGSGGTSGTGGTGSAGDPAAPEECPTPTPPPAPHPTQGSGGRIDDDAWPGWDAGLGG